MVRRPDRRRARRAEQISGRGGAGGGDVKPCEPAPKIEERERCSADRSSNRAGGFWFGVARTRAHAAHRVRERVPTPVASRYADLW